MTASGRQIINVRVHWLPVYASNNCIKALLAPYGKVLDMAHSGCAVGKNKFKYGVRTAILEVSEIEKSKIPHLLQFSCGNKALLTIFGRHPLCLRCLQVGHFRNTRGSDSISEDYFKVQHSISEMVAKITEEKKQGGHRKVQKELEAPTEKDASQS